MSIQVLRQNELPWSAIAREFVGADHGGVGLCVIFGDAKREVQGGDVVLIPPDQPHGFVNSGDGRLRQIDIHVSPSFETDWLEKGES